MKLAQSSCDLAQSVKLGFSIWNRPWVVWKICLPLVCYLKIQEPSLNSLALKLTNLGLFCLLFRSTLNNISEFGTRSRAVVVTQQSHLTPAVPGSNIAISNFDKEHLFNVNCWKYGKEAVNGPFNKQPYQSRRGCFFVLDLPLNLCLKCFTGKVSCNL